MKYTHRAGRNTEVDHIEMLSLLYDIKRVLRRLDDWNAKNALMSEIYALSRQEHKVDQIKMLSLLYDIKRLLRRLDDLNAKKCTDE